MSLTQPKKWKIWSYATLIFCLGAYTLLLLSWERGSLTVERYALPVAFAFFGAAVCRGGVRGEVWAGPLFLLWFVVSRMLIGENYLETSSLDFALMVPAYLVALPFAFSQEGEQRKRGLRVFCWFISLSAAVLAWVGVATAMTRGDITLPVFGTHFYLARYQLFSFGAYPNMGAAYYLIGLMTLGYLVLTVRKKWMILPAVVMGAGLWAATAFSVCRTVMIQWAAMLAGMTLMLCLRCKKVRGVVKTVLTVVLVLAVALGTYKSFSWVSQAAMRQNAQNPLIAQAYAEEETAPTPAPGSETISARPLDLKTVLTLTDRNKIFSACFELIKNKPQVLLHGVLTKDIYREIGPYMTLPDGIVYYHAHNAWLQALVNVGLPGLLLALYMTWMAVRSGWRILFHRPAGQTPLAECWLGFCCPALLLGGITEPFLFTDVFPIGCICFMLLLGYALHTEKQVMAR